MKLLSPAKINLFLKVRFKRKDGYHEIETLFERINLCDTLTISPKSSGMEVRCTDPLVPSGAGNIARRAAELLKKECGVRQGARIFIRKKIPLEAGLGGGSSNAAAVLMGLNRFWKLGLSQRKLFRLSARLGSDVPFFVLNTPFALGRGRGEILRKLSAPRGLKLWHCLVKPPFGISTKRAYALLPASSLTPPPVSNDRGAVGSRSRTKRVVGLTPQTTNVKMLFRSIQKGDSDRLAGSLVNSLEASVNNRVKIIQEIKKELLRHGACGSLMSGSGSAVFGVFLTRREAQSAARRLSRSHKRWKVFVASTF